MFTLYINDIKTLSQGNEINLFADDTNLFCSAENYNELKIKANQLLQNVKLWLSRNGLTLNVQKTHYLDFSKIKNKPEEFRITLGNDILDECENTKYLGMLIQNDLKWDKHINHIIKKINSKIPLFYQLRTIIPETKKILIYNSIIKSDIIYGIELYAKHNTKWVKTLQKAQNRLLKILYRLDRLTSTNWIHKNKGILKITDLCSLRSLLLSHKVVHYFNETNISHKGIELLNYNDRLLRNNLNLKISANFFLKYNKVTERATVLWNDLPNHIKKTSNRKMFKDKIENMYLNNYI